MKKSIILFFSLVAVQPVFSFELPALENNKTIEGEKREEKIRNNYSDEISSNELSAQNRAFVSGLVVGLSLFSSALVVSNKNTRGTSFLVGSGLGALVGYGMYKTVRSILFKYFTFWTKRRFVEKIKVYNDIEFK